MTAPHLQGPPRSTVADAIQAIVAHYAAIASRGPWAPGTAYSVGDQVSNGTVGAGGWVYNCFAAGTSDNGIGPAGMGSQRDANDVGWTPLVYVGERYLRQTGAPPRIIIVPGSGTIESPGRVGNGNIARDVEEIRAYLWAAENADDLARYAAIENAKDMWINVIRKVMPGRAELRTINPTIVANIVTFGEDRQLVATYSRGVPRSGAIWAVPTTPQPTLDAMRPNGDLGTTYVVDPTTDGSH
jgi:hypothetical protein